jgi:hypothetical protein
MTAPEVMNSSPLVDAAQDSPHQARDQSLEMVVEQALDQMRQLRRQRQEIAQRIAIIKRTVNGLAILYGREFQGRPEHGASAERRRGITDACRDVLNRADGSLSAREVYAVLQGEFPDIFRQPRNHYALLVTILNRLVKYGEADSFLRNGTRFWQRRQSTDQRLVGLSRTYDRW